MYITEQLMQHKKTVLHWMSERSLALWQIGEDSKFRNKEIGYRTYLYSPATAMTKHDPWVAFAREKAKS